MVMIIKIAFIAAIILAVFTIILIDLLRWNRKRKKSEFKEQEGIKKLIKDYQLIKAGKSKKGQLKQNRIIGKINWLIEQGILKTEDLTIK